MRSGVLQSGFSWLEQIWTFDNYLKNAHRVPGSLIGPRDTSKTKIGHSRWIYLHNRHGRSLVSVNWFSERWPLKVCHLWTSWRKGPKVDESEGGKEGAGGSGECEARPRCSFRTGRVPEMEWRKQRERRTTLHCFGQLTQELLSSLTFSPNPLFSSSSNSQWLTAYAGRESLK